MLRYRLLAILVLVALTSPAAADQVSERLEFGRKAYIDGRLGTAANELQMALALLRRRLDDQFLAAFPEPPEGWRAMSPDRGMHRAVSGTVLVRNYQFSGSNISVQFYVDNPESWTGNISTALLSPHYAAHLDYAIVEVEGLPRGYALVKWHADQKRAEGMMMIPGRLLIRLNGAGLASEQPVRDLMRAWNIKRVKEIADIP